MQKLVWESFSFVPGVHRYHSRAEAGQLYARDMLNLRADADAYLRLRNAVVDFPTTVGNVTGVAVSQEHLWWLQDGRLFFQKLEAGSTIREVTGVEGMAGRLSLISEYHDFLIVISEGTDRGYWIDFRDVEDTGAVVALPLGLRPPHEGFNIGWTSADSPGADINRGNAVILRLVYVRGIGSEASILAGAPDSEGVADSVLFNGMESNMGSVKIMYIQPRGVARGTLSPVTFKNSYGEVYRHPVDATPGSNLERGRNLVFASNLPHSADPQVTGILVLLSNQFQCFPEDVYDDSPGGIEGTALNIDILPYSVIGYVPKGETSFHFTQTTTLGDPVPVRFERHRNFINHNDRLPAETRSLAFYNSLIFAAVGDELRYCDLRDGAPVQWAWPLANSIRRDTVDFCAEHRGVLLFGGSQGLHRLTGADEFSFDVDALANVGPISENAWGWIQNGLGFLTAGAFYLTDGVAVQKFGSPFLDGYFEGKAIRGGAVQLLPNGDEMWAVRFGDGTHLQFIRSSKEGSWFVHRYGDVRQVEAVPWGSEQRMLFASGSGLRELLWNDFETVEDGGETGIPWAWESQVLDFKVEGYSEAIKHFRWLEVSSGLETEVTVRIWVDALDAVEHELTLSAGFRATRVPIRQRGTRVRFRISGVGEVLIRDMRLVAETRGSRDRF